MNPDKCILVQVLRDSSCLPRLSLKDWDLLIRQARSARLLASLYYLCLDAGVLPDIPQQAFNHLISAQKQAEKTVLSAKWELSLIAKIAAQLKCRVIVLKGAAYAALGFANSRGRIFSDIDLLVSEEYIKDAEAAFIRAGWVSSKTDEYDQIYYRKWMHELPPMTNTQTGVSLDLHHSILPKTAKIKVHANDLVTNANAFDEKNNLFVFANEDMFLHSAVHLFNEGEFEHGLRDLVDLDYMFAQFCKDDKDFPQQLLNRAKTLNLTLPLYYAVRYVAKLMGTTFPDDLSKALESFVPRSLVLMDKLFIRALLPDHTSCDDWFTSTARWLLYVRAHYLRMPPHLLVPHLIRKAYKRRFADDVLEEVNGAQ